jgi:flagellar FliL protein
MAEKKAEAAPPAADAAGAQAAPKKGSKKKLIMIGAVAGVLLLGGGGAAAWMFLGKKPEGTEEAVKAAPKKVPVFVDMDTFTVNLKSADDERFIQVKLVAEVGDAATGETLKSVMPAVRNEILLLLSSKQAEEVSSREGKEQLAKEIVIASNKILETTPATNTIERVNFTHLIIQ